MASFFEWLQSFTQQCIAWYASYKAGQYKEAAENAEVIQKQVVQANAIRDKLDADPAYRVSIRKRYRESPEPTGGGTDNLTK